MSDIMIIESPVKGEWAIYNPPGHPKLAFDLIAVDKKKSPYKKGGLLTHLISFIHVEDTYAWSNCVYSPVRGEVLEACNSAKDRHSICMVFDLFRLLFNKPSENDGFAAFGGNYVVIKTDDYFVLLCHLKQGSVKVKEGDQVVAGQVLGEVGNSGSSIQPHLHIQVMKNKNIFPLFGNLIPFKLAKGKCKSDNNFSEVENFSLANGGHYLFS